MRRTNQWRGEALRVEVRRLQGCNLNAKQIANVMGIAESTARNTLTELGLLARQPAPKTERQVRQQTKLAEVELQMSPLVIRTADPLDRGENEPAFYYAERVLKTCGKMPVVSLLPIEKIARANEELKARGLPQIADRKEWLR